MMTRWLTVLSLAAGFTALSVRAEAQEIQLTGPLKGAPAVKQLRLYRKSRFELAPTVSFTLLDEYRRTVFAGARLQYNITDWLGIGVWGAYGAVSMTTDLTDKIDQTAVRNSRTATNVSPRSGGFADQTSKLTWIAAPQLQFVPFRGKLAIFQKIFVDTDAYVHGGVAFVGVDERRDCGTTISCTARDSFSLQSRTAIAPTFGLGLNFYLSDALALGIEYRAFPFSWNRAGFDSRGGAPDGKFPDNKVDSEDRTFKFNQVISLGLGISFPTKPKSE